VDTKAGVGMKAGAEATSGAGVTTAAEGSSGEESSEVAVGPAERGASSVGGAVAASEAPRQIVAEDPTAMRQAQ